MKLEFKNRGSAVPGMAILSLWIEAETIEDVHKLQDTFYRYEDDPFEVVPQLGGTTVIINIGKHK